MAELIFGSIGIVIIGTAGFVLWMHAKAEGEDL